MLNFIFISNIHLNIVAELHHLQKTVIYQNIRLGLSVNVDTKKIQILLTGLPWKWVFPVFKERLVVAFWRPIQTCILGQQVRLEPRNQVECLKLVYHVWFVHYRPKRKNQNFLDFPVFRTILLLKSGFFMSNLIFRSSQSFWCIISFCISCGSA